MENSDPRSCCKPWDDVNTTTPFNSPNLDSIFLSARTPGLWPGLPSPTSPTPHDCLIERPCPKCVQHRWSDEIATPDHQEAQLPQKTSSQVLSMLFATHQGPLPFSDVPA